MNADDDAPCSEITLLPDGRVYVFGLTAPLRDMLAQWLPADAPEAAVRIDEPAVPATRLETTRD